MGPYMFVPNLRWKSLSWVLLTSITDVRRNRERIAERTSHNDRQHPPQRHSRLCNASRSPVLPGRPGSSPSNTAPSVSLHGLVPPSYQLRGWKLCHGRCCDPPWCLRHHHVRSYDVTNILVLCSRSGLTLFWLSEQGIYPLSFLIPDLIKPPQVNQRTQIPLIAVLLTTVVACLLALINIGSSIAFNALISLTVNGLYSTYLICCILLLYRRCKNQILPYNPHTTPNPLTTKTLSWGPFRLPGTLGIIINVLGVVYLIIILFFSFWPPVTPTTAATMNYSVLMIGAVVLFSVVYYMLVARKVYGGPLVEIEVR